MEVRVYFQYLEFWPGADIGTLSIILVSSLQSAFAPSMLNPQTPNSTAILKPGFFLLQFPFEESNAFPFHPKIIGTLKHELPVCLDSKMTNLPVGDLTGNKRIKSEGRT